MTFPYTGDIASNVASIKTLVRSMYSQMVVLKDEVKNNIYSLTEDLLNTLKESFSSNNTCLEKQQLTELQNSIHGKLELVYHKQDSIYSKLDSLTATTTQLSSDHQQIQANISDMHYLDRTQDMQNNITNQLEKIQDDVTYIYGELTYKCGGIGGWRHVVYLDMTDLSSIYSSSWKLTGTLKGLVGELRIEPEHLETTYGHLQLGDQRAFPSCNSLSM